MNNVLDLDNLARQLDELEAMNEPAGEPVSVTIVLAESFPPGRRPALSFSVSAEGIMEAFGPDLGICIATARGRLEHRHRTKECPP